MRGYDSRPWVTYKSACGRVNHRDLRPVRGDGPQMERTKRMLGSGAVERTKRMLGSGAVERTKRMLGSGAVERTKRMLGSGEVPCTIDSVWHKPWFVITPVISDENWANIITLTKQLGPLQGDAP
jgi:hypothetical protein